MGDAVAGVLTDESLETPLLCNEGDMAELEILDRCADDWWPFQAGCTA